MASNFAGKLLVALAALPVASVLAATRNYDFNVSWVNANPDGMQERRVMGINGQWPIPQISVDVGDQVIIKLYNGLGDVPTSLHFHGLFMNGTSHMDGVGQGTQCPIPPGSTFIYNFTVNQPGTYWYHSHIDGQYPDGLRGPFIVNDASNPYKDLFEEEVILTLSDWYHEETSVLQKRFLSVTNPTGAEPVPESALMNDTQNLQIPVQPGRTYFFRIANMAAFAAQYFWIEGHTFRIIEVDGVYHEPMEADQIYITAAQRYGILVTARNDTTSNFAIVGSMDTDLFDKIPDGLNPNVTSFLVYDSSKEMPKPTDLDEFNPFDDFNLVPTDGEELYQDPVESVVVDVVMDNLGDGANYAFFSGITYVRPKVPTLYTVMTAGEMATNKDIYGENTHSFVLGHNQVYEMVVNNHDPGKHPFHLHGHNFQTVYRSDEEAGDWDAEAVKNGSVTFPTAPMRRDVLLVRPNGNFVIRFRSDNPGVWLFHCHIEWHVVSGLILTFVEAPIETQQTHTIPADHYAACAANMPPMPTAGNAAGNTQDLLDLDGANVSPAPLPAGFTARGIVALVFSCIAGILGVAVIAWYGMAEMGAIQQEREQRKIAEVSQRTDGTEGAASHVAAAATETQTSSHQAKTDTTTTNVQA